jgi:hypothetical protein
MKRTLIILFIIFSVLSCTSQVKDSKYKRKLETANIEYQALLATFEKEYLDHFPKRLDAMPFTYFHMETGIYENNIGLIVQLPLTIDNLDSIVSHAIARYSPDDTFLLIVNRFRNKTNWFKSSLTLSNQERSKINRLCYSDKLPIPNFWRNDLISDVTDCKLPKDFDIYVFEAKSGKFIEKENLTKGIYMPENWKNGFSRGVAISTKRNIIIYWFIAW